MTCTDEQLALWKSAAEREKTFRLKFEPKVFLALLARLEAAEGALLTGHYCHIESAKTCEGCIAQKAWRKAAGR